MKLRMAIENFVNHCQYERGLSSKTLKAYRADLGQLSAYLDSRDEIDVEEIDRDMIREYLKILSEKYEPRTIRRKTASLKSFLSFLEFEDVITVSPIRKMRLSIKLPQDMPRTVQMSDIRKLFKHLYAQRWVMEEAGNDFRYKTLLRDIAVMELLFATGMRVSEVAGLTLDRLDVKHGMVHVIGKGKRERIVPICTTEVKDALKDYLAVRGTSQCNTEAVFLNRCENPLSEQSIRFMVRKRTKAADVMVHITPHMFRHTMATELLGNGMDIRYIQDLLGHSSIMTTQIYAHVTDTARRREMRRRHPRSSMELVNSLR